MYAAQLADLIESDKNKLITHINQRQPQIINRIHHKYKQKYNHLIAKHGRAQEDNPPQVPGIQRHRTRRFTKRNKYKRQKRAEARKDINLVHNICKYTLTEPMTNILNKGLSFVIKPKNTNLTEIRADLAAWRRTIKWKEFHGNKVQSDSDSDNDSDTTPPDLFHVKKSNLPQTVTPQSLDTYLKAVESEILGSINKNTKLNVPVDELKAIQELKKNKTRA